MPIDIKGAQNELPEGYRIQFYYMECFIPRYVSCALPLYLLEGKNGHLSYKQETQNKKRLRRQKNYLDLFIRVLNKRFPIIEIHL